ncbi:MAG: hypothetical protein AB7D29_05350 [Campylobacterales bacterium]
MKRRISTKRYFTHAGILACVSAVKLSATGASCSFFLKSDFSNTFSGLAPPSETSN